MRKVILAGGTGFVGSELINYFTINTYQIFVLTRGKDKTENNINYINWNHQNIENWQNHLDNSDLLINLTGKSVNCVFTEENKKELYSSRIDSVKLLNQAISTLENPPKLFIQCSGLGFYGNVTQPTDEKGTKGNDFLANLTHDWEKEFFNPSNIKTRKIALRMGIVLGENGGALQPLVDITKKFLGGHIGNGKMYMSWFSVKEFHQLIPFLIKNENLDGVFNLCSPNSVTNKEFMSILRNVLNKPYVPPVPEFMFKLIAKYVLKTEPNLILTSQNEQMFYYFVWELV